MKRTQIIVVSMFMFTIPLLSIAANVRANLLTGLVDVIDVTNPPKLSQLQFNGTCGASFWITDPAGYIVGSLNGTIRNDIERASYNRLETERHVITIPSPMNGTYSIWYSGTVSGHGDYWVTITSFAANGSMIASEGFGSTTTFEGAERKAIILFENGTIVYELPVVRENALDYSFVAIGLSVVASILAVAAVSIKRWKKKRIVRVRG